LLGRKIPQVSFGLLHWSSGLEYSSLPTPITSVIKRGLVFFHLPWF
jgi:hypothetical protein